MGRSLRNPRADLPSKSQTARTGGGREKYELDLLLHGPINPKVGDFRYLRSAPVTTHCVQKSVWTLGVRGFDIVVEKSKLAMWPRVSDTPCLGSHTDCLCLLLVAVDTDQGQATSHHHRLGSLAGLARVFISSVHFVCVISWRCLEIDDVAGQDDDDGMGDEDDEDADQDEEEEEEVAFFLAAVLRAHTCPSQEPDEDNDLWPGEAPANKEL